MSDDNNLQHGHAVREPQVGERVEMGRSHALLRSLARSVGVAGEETATGNGDAAESSPLGAFRRARPEPVRSMPRSGESRFHRCVHKSIRLKALRPPRIRRRIRTRGL